MDSTAASTDPFPGAHSNAMHTPQPCDALYAYSSRTSCQYTAQLSCIADVPCVGMTGPESEVGLKVQLQHGCELLHCIARTQGEHGSDFLSN